MELHILPCSLLNHNYFISILIILIYKHKYYIPVIKDMTATFQTADGLIRCINGVASVVAPLTLTNVNGLLVRKSKVCISENAMYNVTATASFNVRDVTSPITCEVYAYTLSGAVATVSHTISDDASYSVNINTVNELNADDFVDIRVKITSQSNPTVDIAWLAMFENLEFSVTKL